MNQQSKGNESPPPKQKTKTKKKRKLTKQQTKKTNKKKNTRADVSKAIFSFFDGRFFCGCFCVFFQFFYFFFRQEKKGEEGASGHFPRNTREEGPVTLCFVLFLLFVVVVLLSGWCFGESLFFHFVFRKSFSNAPHCRSTQPF